MDYLSLYSMCCCLWMACMSLRWWNQISDDDGGDAIVGVTLNKPTSKKNMFEKLFNWVFRWKKIVIVDIRLDNEQLINIQKKKLNMAICWFWKTHKNIRHIFLNKIATNLLHKHYLKKLCMCQIREGKKHWFNEDILVDWLYELFIFLLM